MEVNLYNAEATISTFFVNNQEKRYILNVILKPHAKLTNVGTYRAHMNNKAFVT